MKKHRTQEEVQIIYIYRILRAALKKAIKEKGPDSFEAEYIRDKCGMDELWYKLPEDIRRRFNKNIRQFTVT